jgi:hypothetical protein
MLESFSSYFGPIRSRNFRLRSALVASDPFRSKTVQGIP